MFQRRRESVSLFVCIVVERVPTQSRLASPFARPVVTVIPRHAPRATAMVRVARQVTGNAAVIRVMEEHIAMVVRPDGSHMAMTA